MQNNIYILYGSQTGNAEEVSREIYTLILQKGYNCNYSSLNKTIINEGFTFIQNYNNKYKNLYIWQLHPTSSWNRLSRLFRT
jgi:sulfite reductase alpha subunit-like flavoprotein